MDALRKKYPKWAHRRAYHAKRKRRRKKIRRKTAKTAKTAPNEDLTTLLMMHLMGQIQGVPVSRKHGSNVVTGYAGAVVPDRLAPVRSQDDRARIFLDDRARMHQQAGQRQMAEAYGRAALNLPRW